MDKSSFLSDSDFTISVICSSLIIGEIAYIFVRVNKRLSLPFVVVLSLYLVYATIGLVNLIVISGNSSDQIRSLINSLSLSIIMFALQYFIFQLGLYKIKIDSTSLEDYKRRKKILKGLKYLLLSITCVTSFAKVYIEYMESDPFADSIDHFENEKTIVGFLITLMVFRILGNLFMTFFAINNIKYFIQVKIENLRDQNKQLTKFNVMIIVVLILDIFLRSFGFVTIDSILIARLISDISKNYTLQSLWIIVRIFITPPRHLIESTLICYMIFY